jgi:hypothetical protein
MGKGAGERNGRRQVQGAINSDVNREKSGRGKEENGRHSSSITQGETDAVARASVSSWRGSQVTWRLRAGYRARRVQGGAGSVSRLRRVSSVAAGRASRRWGSRGQVESWAGRAACATGRERDARGERKLGEREKREGRESPWRRRQQGGATTG